MLDQLSGSMAWRGNILARKSSAEVSITSRLIGLASTLSEPLAKTAAEALPLRFERKLLATGADPGERDVTGETPLHKAARRGHPNSVQALIESGADVNEMDSLGMSSLHWVAMNGRTDVAEILLSAGADVHSRDYAYTSMTPLGVAKLMGYDEVADMIGAYGGGY